MATWTVHARDGDVERAVATDGLVLLREGWSWPAFLVPFVWAPWNRLWLVFLGWLAATVAIQGLDHWAGGSVGAIVSFAFMFWFALEANELRRWTLERRGFALVGLIEAGDAVEAEARFLTRWSDPARARFGVVGAAHVPHREPFVARTATSAAATDLPPIVGFTGLTGGHT
ncbi:MAG: DUF2628 domain-containing protein [Siculibacillus sp.]